LINNNNNKGNKHPINNAIKAQTLRVIFDDINQIMSFQDAIRVAISRDLDLVQLNNEQCPTCRIMDYSKYLFEEKKRKKLQTNNRSTMKEIQVKPSISKNDLLIKKKQIDGFLEKGSEVRLRIKLKGREKISSDQHGLFLMDFAKGFEAYAKIEAKLSSTSAPIGGIVTLKPIKKN
jgi:translation initiation factor IF-3